MRGLEGTEQTSRKQPALEALFRLHELTLLPGKVLHFLILLLAQLIYKVST
jgi:hypothetical protein